MSADFIQDVFVPLFAADFKGQIIQLVAKQAEFFTTWAARIRAGQSGERRDQTG
jgi:hypothetical protein